MDKREVIPVCATYGGAAYVPLFPVSKPDISTKLYTSQQCFNCGGVGEGVCGEICRTCGGTGISTA